MIDFVAVDVETANSSAASICQIGLVQYTGSKIAKRWASFVDPEDTFSPLNISIHGIRPETVAGAPRWPEIARTLCPFLDGKVLLSHTAFDRVALRQAFQKCDLRLPDCRWLDSARVARRTWSQFASRGYGLENICAFPSYDFRPHDALEDAMAAGHIFLAAMKASGLTVDGWLAKIESAWGNDAPNKTVKTERVGGIDPNIFCANRVVERAVDELVGLCKGIVADGLVTPNEARFLEEWLSDNRHAAKEWPANVLYQRLCRIFEDGKIDSEERSDLLDLLLKITGGGLPSADSIGMSPSTQLPFDDPQPEILFKDCVFCFTGKFVIGSREHCEGLVRERGGRLKSSPTMDTNYLVIGATGSEAWIHSTHGRKIETALRLREKRLPIAIIAEKHWTQSL